MNKENLVNKTDIESKKEIRSGLKKGYPYEEVDSSLKYRLLSCGVDTEGISLMTPPDDVVGDYGFNCVNLARQQKTSPKVYAQNLTEKLNQQRTPGLIGEYHSIGPYINFELNYDLFAPAVIKSIFDKKDSYGYENIGNGAKIIVDLSSPNIAKRMSIGHLRSTVIGDAVANILEFQGFKVVRDNHLGDWGTQFGHLVQAVEMWGDMEEIAKNPIEELQKLYVKINTAIKDDEALNEKGQEKFRLLEQGDPKIREMWQQIVEWSLKDFQKIYDALDVKYDLIRGESFYESMLPATIDRIKKTIGSISDGALIIDLKDVGLRAQLVQKSNGSTLYFTRELATGIHRFEEEKADGIVYVVGEDQVHYFKQFFEAMKRLGYPTDKCKHVHFGMISLPEGKMSTREGRTVLLEDVIEELMNKTREIVSEKLRDGEKEVDEDLVKTIAIGSLKWFDLSRDPKRSVTFDWDSILNINANSALYSQYTHARICSVLEKVPKVKNFENLLLTNDLEKQLTKQLAKFPEIVKEAGKDYSPSLITSYIDQLCRTYNNFYHNCPIRDANKESRRTRTIISMATNQVLENGLKLLGIQAPDTM